MSWFPWNIVDLCTFPQAYRSMAIFPKDRMSEVATMLHRGAMKEDSWVRWSAIIAAVMRHIDLNQSPWVVSQTLSRIVHFHSRLAPRYGRIHRHNRLLLVIRMLLVVYRCRRKCTWLHRGTAHGDQWICLSGGQLLFKGRPRGGRSLHGHYRIGGGVKWRWGHGHRYVLGWDQGHGSPFLPFPNGDCLLLRRRWWCR